MKPLTTDQPLMQPQLQDNTLDWLFDPNQHLMLDPTLKDASATPSTDTSSPPFSFLSASPQDTRNGHARVLGNAAPYGSHVVGESPTHRRQNSASRTGSTPEHINGSYSQSTTPRSRSFDTRPGHPYAFPTNMQTIPGMAAKRRRQLDQMTEDEHLESLWTMHGVTGSHHLGAGLTDQLASTTLTPDWNTDPASATSMLEPSLFYDPGASHFTVDPSLRQPYEVHHPFSRQGDNHFHLGEEDPLHPTLTEMDLGDEVLEDSPHSEDMDPPNEISNKKATSSDLNATAGTSDKNQADSDGEDKDTGSAEHDHSSSDKAQASKPAANNFVNKLHLMISDPKAADFIWWTDLGTSFVVSSAGEFSRSILGQHFKHSNFSSFVRQLNMYGFHKINRTPRNQRVQPDAQQWEFSHPKFLRGRQDLLEDIKRKPVEPDSSTARQRVELPSEVAAKLRQMATEHAEVVNALQIERKRVMQLATIVKVLYDRVATAGPLPVAFPHDLLNTQPLQRNSNQDNAMDLLGNSLIPSRSATTANRSHQQATQSNSTARAARRVRPDADSGHQSRVSSGSGSTECLPNQELSQASVWSNIAASQTPFPNASNIHVTGIHPQQPQNNQIKQESNVFVR